MVNKILLPKRKNTLLLVVDVQERLMAAMPEHVVPNVLRNICILIQAASEYGMPVLVTEQYPKGLGPTVAEVRDAFPTGTLPVEKLTFSCCQEPTFPLSANPSDNRYAGYNVILCGAETHVCVLQTALDLLSDGRQVFVAADAICSRAKLNWQLGLDLMRQAGAVIGSTEIFAFGLLHTAGTEQFKRISRLVK